MRNTSLLHVAHRQRTMDKARSAYHSYLLRLWRDSAHGAWRISLQSTKTEQVYHFANLESLLAFLDAIKPEPTASEKGAADQTNHPIRCNPNLSAGGGPM